MPCLKLQTLLPRRFMRRLSDASHGKHREKCPSLVEGELRNAKEKVRRLPTLVMNKIRKVEGETEYQMSGGKWRG